MSDRRRHQFQREVHLLICRTRVQAEAQAGARALRQHAHRCQHMRGLRSAGHAGRATGDGQSLQVERDHQRLAFQVIEPEIRRIRHSRRFPAIDSSLIHARKNALLQPVAQCGEPRGTVARDEGLRHLRRMSQPDDARQVLRAGAALAFLRSAEEQRLRMRAPPDVECAGALRPMELVAGDGQQIAADRLHIDRHLARRLHRIGMEVHIGFLRDGADLSHRLQCADLVVGHHHADELRIRPKGTAYVLGINHAGRIDGQKRDLDAAIAQPLRRMEHGMMLDGAGDKVIARLQHAGQGQVIALRAAAGEDDLRRAAPQQARHLLAGTLHGGPGTLAVKVDGGGVAELLGKPRAHGREHLRRERRGGIGIHVDAAHG